MLDTTHVCVVLRRLDCASHWPMDLRNNGSAIDHVKQLGYFAFIPSSGEA